MLQISLLLRRLALAITVLALPLAVTATLPNATATPVVAAASSEATPAQAEAARKAAAEAEARAKQLANALPGQKSRVKKQLTKANKATTKFKKTQKRVKKLKKRWKKAQRTFKKKKTAKARKQVRKLRKNVNKRTVVMKRQAKKRTKAWAAWRTHRDIRDRAIVAIDQAEKKAVDLRETAHEMTAQATVVTSATLQVLPPIRQASASVAAADSAKRVVFVEAKPGVRYLPVQVEQEVDGTWTPVAEGRTRELGRVEIEVPGSGPFRAVVKGATSAAARDEWTEKYTDEFNGTTLSDDWTHRMTDLNPGGQRTCAQGDPAAVTQGNGSVQLWVKKNTKRKANCSFTDRGVKYSGHSYRLNGHIGTQTSFSFKYGVAAARIKWQNAAEGQHGAFWMQPIMHRGSGIGAEIDVVEFNGYKPNLGIGRLFHTIYRTDPANLANKNQTTSGFFDDKIDDYLADKDDKWFNRYHVFSVEWSPTGYVFRIDGVETWRTDQNISQREQFLVLSLLSSDWGIARGGAEAERALGTQKMDVDWIRVWQQ